VTHYTTRASNFQTAQGVVFDAQCPKLAHRILTLREFDPPAPEVVVLISNCFAAVTGDPDRANTVEHPDMTVGSRTIDLRGASKMVGVGECNKAAPDQGCCLKRGVNVGRHAVDDVFDCRLASLEIGHFVQFIPCLFACRLPLWHVGLTELGIFQNFLLHLLPSQFVRKRQLIPFLDIRCILRPCQRGSGAAEEPRINRQHLPEVWDGDREVVRDYQLHEGFHGIIHKLSYDLFNVVYDPLHDEYHAIC